MLTPDEKTMRDAQVMDRFLTDETVLGAFERVEKSIFAEFKSAQSPEARTAAWAKSRALDDLRAMLRAVVDAGAAVTAKRERAQRTGALPRSTI